MFILKNQEEKVERGVNYTPRITIHIYEKIVMKLLILYDDLKGLRNKNQIPHQ